MFNFSVRGNGTVDGNTILTPGQRHEVKFEWNGLQDLKSDSCQVSVDGAVQDGRLPLNRPSPNGISYVHFQSTATAEDPAGFLLESVAAEVK